MTYQNFKKLDPATTAAILDCSPVEMKYSATPPISLNSLMISTYRRLHEMVVEQGITTFVSTFSKGFAITAGMALLHLKNRHPQIQIITLCTPHFVNEKYSPSYLRQYAQILAVSRRVTPLLSAIYPNTPTTRHYAQKLLTARTPNHLKF